MNTRVAEPKISSSPKVALAHYKDAIGPALERMFMAAEVGKSAIARMIGMSRTDLGKMLDEESTRNFPLAAAFLLPDAVRRMLAQELIGDGYMVVEAISADTELDHLRHMHRVIKEGGEAASAYAEAISDGVITPGERQQVIKELRETIAADRALLELLESEGNRVVSIHQGAK